ncbi:MAG: arsenite efflux transporter metallochaperone ArsD [Acidibrevibacterium sp.]|uniref:arsenite efflux transporter metallochaperone ArsD n=1 Tax=Acidibrevibacterium sp. TaxID=2606776 RepID=UPI003CFC6FFC
MEATDIQVFDPALCCSTGVCGVDVDPQLIAIAADLAWARQQGAKVERFNLGQQPMVFVNNATVKGILDRSGQSALPLILVNGQIALVGRYPQRAELARWLGMAAEAQAAEPPAARGCCGPAGDCC